MTWGQLNLSTTATEVHALEAVLGNKENFSDGKPVYHNS